MDCALKNNLKNMGDTVTIKSVEDATTPSSQVSTPPPHLATAPSSGVSGTMLVIVIAISVVCGSVSGVLADRYILPVLSTVPWLSKISFLHSDQPVVVNKTEQVSVDENSATIDAVRKVSPSVVSISSTSDAFDVLGRKVSQQSSGTGFVITSDGLIVTNKHVVSDSSAKYTVVTSDGQIFDASVVDRDPALDIALVKVDAHDLPIVALGSSESLQIGQRAIAIGNALGQYKNTVTEGVISATDRSITAGADFVQSEHLEGLIQTDAAISPGNSGGPLVDITGRVVGVNTAIDQSGQNIGFAIPIDAVKPAIDSFTKTGHIARAMIGVRYVNITPELARVNNLSETSGALVTIGENNEPAVVPGSPAESAGLKAGDIIKKIDDTKLDGDTSLSTVVQNLSPGKSVTITYIRDGKTQTATITLAELK